MPRWTRMLPLAFVSGTAATLTSSLALAGLSRAAGKGALQPVNATSHWKNGEAAASVRRADLAHTGVGFATHFAATLFWAVLFEAWIHARRPLSPRAALRDAAGLSCLAAAVDYGATPKRFTPGWEFVLSKRAMAAAYGAMAAGFAAMARLPRNAA